MNTLRADGGRPAGGREAEILAKFWLFLESFWLIFDGFSMIFGPLDTADRLVYRFSTHPIPIIFPQTLQNLGF